MFINNNKENTDIELTKSSKYENREKLYLMLNISNDEIKNKYLDIIKQENIKLINNPFRKYNPVLKYQDISNKELLFWRIFRNKYIFYKIFSFYHFKWSYYDITVKSLKYYSNSLEVIKDKIKSNGFINIGIKEFKSLIKLCSIKKFCKKESHQYYNLLYEQVPHYFSMNNFNIILRSNNINILKIFIENNKNGVFSNLNYFDIYYKSNFKSYNGLYNHIKVVYYLFKNGYIKNNNIKIKNNILNSIYEDNNLKIKQIFKLYKMISDMNINTPLNSHQLKKDIKKNFKLTKNQLNQNIIPFVNNLHKNKLEVFCNLLKYIDYSLQFPKHLITSHNDFENQNFKSGGLNSIYFFFNKLQFIKLILNNINRFIDKESILIYILNNSNKKIIKKLFNNYNNLYTHSLISKYKTIIIQNINSKKILNIYYNKFKDQLFKNKNSNWIYFNSLEIYEYYELLMKSLGRIIIVSNEILNYNILNIQSNSVEILANILLNSKNNKNLYKIDINSLSNYIEILKNQISSYHYQYLISILSCGVISKISLYCFSFDNIILKDYFELWIIKNTISAKFNSNENAILQVLINNNKTIEIEMGFSDYLISSIKCGYCQQAIKIIINSRYTLLANNNYRNKIPFHFIKKCIDHYYISKNETIKSLLLNIFENYQSSLLYNILKYIAFNYDIKKLGIESQEYIELYNHFSNENSKVKDILEDFNFINQ